ncbi:DNA-binding domain-containing protein [Croceicoccus gelatinilyticus]|uniref:HvfC/BufC N-terminal domain-containing protein n=1 Tax=Croceicoccus gelatinilyticus TaxID=2835536 RepID=UPI001BCE426F|nr:DNA-binding domain-containing protein [Croceicoccus gelatinilyticus]MBS7670699.1 putative DNA-binding domain-containing protein [Croceicoccus gelatinilyticus]
MTLAAFQDRFLDALRCDEAALPVAWSEREERGFAIYRNAYRTRLVEVLENAFPRTRRLVGEDAFTTAAIHHLIEEPPSSWTIDDAGRGFDVTLAALFSADPDVAECAWIEWAMGQALVAAEGTPLDAAGFAQATARFADEDWHAMRLSFVPGFAVRTVTREWSALWPMLGEGGDLAAARSAPTVEPAMGAVVCREDRTPAFLTVGQLELAALTQMTDGATYGAMCEALVHVAGEEAAIAGAGGLLARWLKEGWIAAVS